MYGWSVGSPGYHPIVHVYTFMNIVYIGIDVNVANFLGLREVNLVLNVILLVALIAVLATIIETRIQIIERIGNYH